MKPKKEKKHVRQQCMAGLNISGLGGKWQFLLPCMYLCSVWPVQGRHNAITVTKLWCLHSLHYTMPPNATSPFHAPCYVSIPCTMLRLHSIRYATLHSIHYAMSPFHALCYVSIPCTMLCLHSIHYAMSPFHALCYVSIPCTMLCLHSMQAKRKKHHGLNKTPTVPEPTTPGVCL